MGGLGGADDHAGLVDVAVWAAGPANPGGFISSFASELGDALAYVVPRFFTGFGSVSPDGFDGPVDGS